MKFPWMKYGCEPHSFQVFGNFQFIGLVIYVSDDFSWPCVFGTQGATLLVDGEIFGVDIYHVSYLVVWMWGPRLIGISHLICLCLG